MDRKRKLEEKRAAAESKEEERKITIWQGSNDSIYCTPSTTKYYWDPTSSRTGSDQAFPALCSLAASALARSFAARERSLASRIAQVSS
jgi:hypothetical protein